VKDLERVDTVERRPDRVFLWIDVVLRGVIMLSEPETVRNVGIAAENMNDVPLIHDATIPEAAQDSPDELMSLATEPTGVSIYVACEIRHLVKLIL
jgi:hypothetical protein